MQLLEISVLLQFFHYKDGIIFFPFFPHVFIFDFNLV